MIEAILGALAALVGVYLYWCEVYPRPHRRRIHEPKALKLLPEPDSPEKLGGQPLSPIPLGSFGDCYHCHKAHSVCEEMRSHARPILMNGRVHRLACCSRCYHKPPPTSIPGDGMPVSR